MNRKLCMLLSVSAVLITGCVGITDKATFLDNKRLYVKNAEGQIAAGNWANARRTYTLALNNAQWAEDTPQEMANLNYGLGRANGVTCRFDEATQNFNAALEFDKQTKGPSYRSLVELGRLNLAQKKSTEAVEFFSQALPELDKAKLAERDPAALADVLDDYAAALEAGGGKAAQVAATKAKAAALQSANAGKAAKTARAPYGTQCETATK